MAHQDQGTSPQEDQGLEQQPETDRAQQKAQSAESHPYPEDGQPPSSGNPAQTIRHDSEKSESRSD